jgi:hypothetical protein
MRHEIIFFVYICKHRFTDKELHDAVEGNVLVVAVQEHVGQEPPDLAAPVRVVDQVGADQPVVVPVLLVHAQGLRREHATKQKRLRIRGQCYDHILKEMLTDFLPKNSRLS